MRVQMSARNKPLVQIFKTTTGVNLDKQSTVSSMPLWQIGIARLFTCSDSKSWCVEPMGQRRKSHGCWDVYWLVVYVQNRCIPSSKLKVRL